MADEEVRVVESDATLERGLVSEFVTVAADAGIIQVAEAGLDLAYNLVTGGGEVAQATPAVTAVDPGPTPESSDE